MIQRINEKWTGQYSKNESVATYTIIVIIALSFVLSDWLLGAFTFTEYILGGTILVSFLIGKFRVYKQQLKWIVLPLITIILHTLLLMSLGNEIDIRIIIISVVKLIFYLVITTWVINLVRDFKLKNQFLLIINCFAIVVFLLGIYIALAFYLNLNHELDLPYEFLLRFTRIDGHLFRSDVPIVRMKSIFEEPAHLGYYFNTVLLINAFGNHRLNYKWLFSSVLVTGIVLTFSYSAIAIMMIILTTQLIMALFQRKIKFRFNYSFIAAILSVLVIVFVFRDVLYTTFIGRTLELISGTETSGYERLFDSWRFITSENLIFGLGYMQTPGSLWNNFAYFTTEFGLIGLAFLTGFNIWIFYHNKGMGVAFLLMNFAKGGYLSSSYWFLLLLVLLYSLESETVSYFRKEEHFEIKRRF